MFYFISFTYFDEFNCKVIDEHPIKWYNKTKFGYELVNWKEISEDEYNMWEE